MEKQWFQLCEKGNTQEIINMLKCGFDINAKNHCGETGLMLAVRGRRIETIEELIRRGINIHVADKARRTAMTWAAVQARGLVIQKPRPWSIRDPDTRPLEALVAAGALFSLREVVILNDVSMAHWLCESNMSISVNRPAYFSFDDTFLMLASELGSLEMVDFLLGRGADLEGTNDIGITALMRAAESGHSIIVTRLLDLGADVNHGWPEETALSMAEAHSHQEVASLLLSRNAKRRLVDAVHRDDIQLAIELLDQGAYPEAELVFVENDAINHNIHPYRWDRLLVYAATRGNVGMVRMLLDHGAILEKEQRDYRTPLEEASSFGHIEIVKLLISCGADMNVVGISGLSALELAIRMQHDEVVEFLNQKKDTPR